MKLETLNLELRAAAYAAEQGMSEEEALKKGTSLAHEQFVKGDIYREFLAGAEREIDQFRRSCEKAGIPEIKAKKSLRDILAWALNVLKIWRPRLTYKLPHDGGAVDLDLFGNILPAAKPEPKEGGDPTPHYISDVKERLEAILRRAELSLWLMVDRLIRSSQDGLNSKKGRCVGC